MGLGGPPPDDGQAPGPGAFSVAPVPPSSSVYQQQSGRRSIQLELDFNDKHLTSVLQYEPEKTPSGEERNPIRSYSIAVSRDNLAEEAENQLSPGASGQKELEWGGAKGYEPTKSKTDPGLG